MGYPISAILSEIFLQNLDVKIQQIINNYDNKSIWLQYVDDALCIINTNTDPNNILQEINELHNNIKFTIVKKENRQTIRPNTKNRQKLNKIFTENLHNLISE